MSSRDAAGANAAWLLLGQRAAGLWGGRPYLWTGEGEKSYGQVLEEVARTAGFLASRGLTPGERVVLAMNDRAEAVVAFWGALWAGLVAVPLAPALAAPEMRRVLVDCQASLVVADPPTARVVASAAEGLSCALVVAEGPFWQASAAACEPVAVAEDSLALLLYTSGTTGHMKGVAHSHGNLLAAAAGLGPQVLHLTPEDRLFSAPRMFFAYGLGNSVYIPAAAGASAVLHPGPMLPGVVREVLERARPTVFFAVPSLLAALLELPGPLTGRLRVVVSAGEPLDPALGRAVGRKLGAPVLDGLGMTETLHHITSNRLGELVPGSAGRPLAGFLLEARDEEGKPVPEGEVGELWVAGPSVMQGYWQQPQLSARALVGGFLRTGDLVSLRAGYLYHHGRRDELIKLGGLAVFPSEVEKVLKSHPAVAEAAVVPVRRGAGVVALKALVVLQPGASLREGELLRFCRRRLASFKVPREYELVASLPRTVTGKLRRLALTQAAEP